MQKNKKDSAPALVVVELQSPENYQVLIDNLKRYNINYTALNKNDNVFAYLV
jgi:threonine dehydratase